MDEDEDTNMGIDYRDCNDDISMSAIPWKINFG